MITSANVWQGGVVKAVVLCAGYGKRLGRLTALVPKPMLLIHGEPLLAYTLRYLRSHGIRDVAINLHHFPEQIPDYFGSGADFDMALRYSHEETLLGTAGSVKHLAEYLGNEEEFLVLYGDLLIDQDLGQLIDFHRRHGALATLVLHRRPGSNSLVKVGPGGRITGFLERPTPAQRRANPWPWVNSGLQVLNYAVLEMIPDRSPADLPLDLYAPSLATERLYGFPLSGYRTAIDSPERYARAQADVASGRYHQAPLLRRRRAA